MLERFLRDMRGALVPRWFSACIRVGPLWRSVSMLISFSGFVDDDAYIVGICESSPSFGPSGMPMIIPDVAKPKVEPRTIGQQSIEAPRMLTPMERAVSHASSQSSESEVSFKYSKSLDDDDDDGGPTTRLISGHEVSVQTNLVWLKTGFRCRCCARPPLPPGDASLRLGKALPSSGRSGGGHGSAAVNHGMDGHWVIQPQFRHVAHDFMQELSINGMRCFDATGRKWRLRQEGSSILLLRGKLWVANDTLYREGKSGVTLSF